MPMVKLDRVELWDALELWGNEHPVNGYAHYESGSMFMKYLGIKSWQDMNGHIEMPEEALRRLRMLNGPHGRTVIKAWYAKHY